MKLDTRSWGRTIEGRWTQNTRQLTNNWIQSCGLYRGSRKYRSLSAPFDNFNRLRKYQPNSEDNKSSTNPVHSERKMTEELYASSEVLPESWWKAEQLWDQSSPSALKVKEGRLQKSRDMLQMAEVMHLRKVHVIDEERFTVDGSCKS